MSSSQVLAGLQALVAHAGPEGLGQRVRHGRLPAAERPRGAGRLAKLRQCPSAGGHRAPGALGRLRRDGGAVVSGDLDKLKQDSE